MNEVIVTLICRGAIPLTLLATSINHVLAPVALADETNGAAVAHFERRVRPLLANQCFDCHSEDNAESELRVDSLAGLLRGGLRGPAIVVGDAERSLLIRVIRHGEELKMPPKRKLPRAEIANLARWIDEGAIWPGSPDANGGTGESAAGEGANAESLEKTQDGRASGSAGTQFWSLRKPRLPRVPDVRNQAWPRNDIDRFILHRLESSSLHPAARAGKHTLIRRATLTLLGLPPTPNEVDAFLRDDRPDAFARVVDRLLGSPRYGERWGRHWLDVARYADSNGLDENLAHANAFRYRDYVVASFNGDKPFDQFAREQIAGDLLDYRAPEQRIGGLVATGFLCIGPKMLAEDDPTKLRMDIVDEQVDTIGRAFLGMTFGCARCHDHKFDPVSMRDYYALAGIFASTKTMDSYKVVAQWHERPLAIPERVAELEQQRLRLNATQQGVERLRNDSTKTLVIAARQHVGDYLLAAENQRREQEQLRRLPSLGAAAVAGRVANAVLLEAEDFPRGNVRRDRDSYGKGIGVLVNQGQTPNFVEYDIELPARGNYRLEVRYAAAASRPCRLAVNGRPVKDDLAGRVTGGWNPDSQQWSVECIVELRQGKNVVRLEHPQFFPHIDKLLFAPIERSLKPDLPPLAPGYEAVPPLVQRWVAALSSGLPALATWNRLAGEAGNSQQLRQLALAYQRAAASKTKAVGDTRSQPPASAEKDVRAESTTADDRKSAVGLDVGETDALRRWLNGPESPFRDHEKLDAFFPAPVRKSLAMLEQQRDQLQSSMPTLPTAMAVEEDVAKNLRIHYRGSHLTLGPEVRRGFPAALTSVSQKTMLGQSGRKELAEWLTDREHPLTARVLVNRVWHWHFGEGLVRSPDNFGQLGERPTHPELLDWLACQFMDSGWSIKQLHRRILLSATWQMSATRSALAESRDPENRLWSHRPRRRLEAEAIRDSLLALGGNLDLQMTGSLLPTPNRKYVTSTANVDPVVYENRRRSLYLPVVRSALYDVFQAFDFSDPSVLNGKRQSTTVAPQALFMMNSRLVAQQSEGLADRLLAEATSDETRVDFLYRLAYARRADDAESIRALQFVEAYERQWSAAVPSQAAVARRRAWQSLCRAVLASNEFVYVD